MLETTITNQSGQFTFTGDQSSSSQEYLITVNGSPADIGSHVMNVSWGQWAGVVSAGYSSKHIVVAHSAPVVLPMAALFTNSSYATLHFASADHDGYLLHVGVEDAGILAGFVGSNATTFFPWAISFWGIGRTGGFAGQPYYATSLWCDSGTFCMNKFGGYGLRVAGLAGPVPHWATGTYGSHEYINSTTPALITRVVEVPAGGQYSLNLTLAGSVSWSEDTGVPFAIHYFAYEIQINLNLTLTTITGTSYIGANIQNTSILSKCFAIYPIIGVPELHVWEIACPN